MLSRLPTATPPLSVMLDDLANPKPRDLAKLLGVPERSLRISAHRGRHFRLIVDGISA